jgi:hypothetical protein
MNALAEHAQARILRFGADDALYSKYFGNASITGPLGFFHALQYGDKSGVVGLS